MIAGAGAGAGVGAARYPNGRLSSLLAEGGAEAGGWYRRVLSGGGAGGMGERRAARLRLLRDVERSSDEGGVGDRSMAWVCD